MGVRNDKIWMMRLEACRKFAQENNGRFPPQSLVVDGFALGIWFNNQNKLLSCGSMPKDRQQIWTDFLEEVHWKKHGNYRDDVRWVEQFEVYKRYVREYCKFPSMVTDYEGYPIGEWLHNQVTAMQIGRLFDDRKAMLDGVHPAWCASILVKREAEKELVQRYGWRHKVPAGDICLDEVLKGADLAACLVKGIFGCRQYLEAYYQMRNGKNAAFLEASESFPIAKQFGSGVFSLTNRKDVFEACFPKTSFVGFHLVCAIQGLNENGTYLQDAEWYNQQSQFMSAAEMEEFVRDLFDTLPDSAARIFAERFVEGLPFEQIAKGMEVSRARVHQVYKTWLVKIRRMEEWGDLQPRFEKSLSDVLEDASFKARVNSGKSEQLQDKVLI